MRFPPDTSHCRRIPIEFLVGPLDALARRDIASRAQSLIPAPETHGAPPPLPPRWVDMVQGDVSLDDLFR